MTVLSRVQAACLPTQLLCFSLRQLFLHCVCSQGLQAAPSQLCTLHFPLPAQRASLTTAQLNSLAPR